MAQDILIGNENFNDKERKTQVFLATHDGAGTRLPYMNRSFISFMYGGKHIEDFGLIAIIKNNSLTRQLYSDFNDQISEYDILDGQLYWGTHFKANKLSLNLFTDEITERQLQTFSSWFKPGVARELILAEHPNRGIMARIENAPQYNMLPFEKKITSVAFGRTTSTTVYRGEITITFIMDDPYWYALTNMLEGRLGNWDNEIITTDEDALKVIEEDGIPTRATLTSDVLVGDTICAESVGETARTAMTAEIGASTFPEETKVGKAYIGGRLVFNTNDVKFNLGFDEVKYFYYAGTAPCYPILEFTINFNTDGENYCNTLYNNYVLDDLDRNYSSIFIEGYSGIKELKITTPNLITAYNQAISLKEASDEEKRNKINHYKVRAAAVRNQLSLLFNSTTTAKFIINCQTGEATVEYTLFRNEILKEDAGDMVCSNYIKIEDRNYPNEEGYIIYDESNLERAHKFYHNIQSGLNDVVLKYKHMYL